VPRFVIGYLVLAVVRVLGDRFVAGAPAWPHLVEIDRVAVDITLVTVAASIGLHLELASVLGSGIRAIAIGGAASFWMATVALAMVVSAARGAPAAAALSGVAALGAAFAMWRVASGREGPLRLLRARFDAGLPLSLAEATQLLDAGEWDDDGRRRLLRLLHPSIGELIPARESSYAHGDGTRWLTYWEGRSGWALVAVCREPGSTTPVHAHPHRLLAKTIEGSVEELRFSEDGTTLVLTERKLFAHDELVETEGLDTIHVIRNVGPRVAIDLQLRGPEQGQPGRRLKPAVPIDLTRAPVGARFAVEPEVDDRPGHAGEGPSAGRLPETP
jgi:hypothetical protein